MFHGPINTFLDYLFVLVVLDEHDSGNVIPVKTDRDEEGLVDGNGETSTQKLTNGLEYQQLLN